MIKCTRVPAICARPSCPTRKGVTAPAVITTLITPVAGPEVLLSDFRIQCTNCCIPRKNKIPPPNEISCKVYNAYSASKADLGHLFSGK